MFLYSHELNYVIPCFLDSFQIVVSKISVNIYFTPFLSHSNMCFVNTNALFRLRNWSFMCPFKFFIRIPPEAIIKVCVWVLHSHTSPGRVSISSMTIRTFDVDFVSSVVRNSALSILCRDSDIEASKIIFTNSKFFSIPVIELSKYCN